MSLGHRPGGQQSALSAGHAASALPDAGRVFPPTPRFFSGPGAHRGRPREGTAEAPQPGLARADSHHLPGFVANLCLRAPRVPESLPGGLSVQSWAWRAGWARHWAFRARTPGAGGHAPVLAGRGEQGPGGRAGRVRMPVLADTSGRGLCSDVHLARSWELRGEPTSALADLEKTRGVGE